MGDHRPDLDDLRREGAYPRHLRYGLTLLFALVGLSAIAAPPPPAPAAPLADQGAPVLLHAGSVARWYRQIEGGGAWVAQPSEAYFFTTQRQLGEKALRAEFDAALAEATLIGGNATGTKSAAEEARAVRLAAFETATEQKIQKLTEQLSAAADGQKDILQAQFDLAKAQVELIQKVKASAADADQSTAATLLGQIEALEHSLPEVFGGAPPPPAAVTPPTTAGDSDGLIARAVTLYTLTRTEKALQDLADQTTALERNLEKLQAPILAQIKAIIAQSQQDGPQVSRDVIDGWTVRYRQLSAVIVPMSLERQVLAQSIDNLQEWHDAIKRQADYNLRHLASWVGGLAAVLILLLIFSEIWRRATFKYVHDARRRRQFLLVRRIVTGAVMVLTLVLGLVSGNFSSLATFAGFITAGIAVALQSVILSVAAYFFLIGRYGVKVGDRVTISGVAGEVMDVGLIRVYLMELGGTGIDLYTTGRLVVFANSALFSATSPLYKQIPGTDFTWHEMYAVVKPAGDPAYVRQRIFEAVTAVYADYRPSLERQHSAVERLIDIRIELPEPAVALRLGDAGVEAVVRYPVEIRRGGEIDAAITLRVLGELAADAKFKDAMEGTPKIRAAVKA